MSLKIKDKCRGTGNLFFGLIVFLVILPFLTLCSYYFMKMRHVLQLNWSLSRGSSQCATYVQDRD